MIALPIVRKTLRDQRLTTISLAGISLGLALLHILVYPEYSKGLEDFEIPAAFKGLLGEAGSIASPEGFLTIEFFSWVPLLYILIAIVGGTGTLAGEESAGTLDLLLAQPVGRRRLLLEKAGGLAAVVIIAALASLPGFFLGMILVDIDITVLQLVAAVANTLPVTFLYLGLALWLAALLPGRASAAVLSVGAVVVAFFLYNLGAVVGLLEVPAKASPFYWSDPSRVLIDGFQWVRAAGLMVVAGAFLTAAVVAFERRDIAAGAGPGWGALAARWRPSRRGAPGVAPAK